MPISCLNGFEMITRILILIILAVTPTSSGAQTRISTPPQFAFPADCTLDQDCWIVNYPDVDPGEGDNAARDYRCNAKTYDGHKGTDFALRSLKEVEQGIDVLAVRAGTVLRMRDGEKDGEKTPQELDDISKAGRECGNGILIDHGDNVSSIYCHLKQGSIAVKSGDKVKTGQKIAQIGQSGRAEFPHLHIGMTWKNEMIDPFTGLSLGEGCGKFKDNLWTPDIQYVPFAIYDAGFRDGAPDFDAIKAGQDHPQTLPASSKALVFFGAMYGVEKGDNIRLEITAPDGSVFIERDIVQDKTRARQYYYTGRKTARGLNAGQYTGRIILRRDDIQKSMVKHITVQ